MDDFEKAYSAKFDRIRKATGAFLYFLHPPMRCRGVQGTMPVFVQTGRALFDVAGWLPVKGEYYPLAGLDKKMERIFLPNPRLAAVAIGVELKRNKEAQSSMRIVGQDGSGSGIQAHQLEALAAVHRDGGIARVLWNNGGQIAVLDGEQIAAAYFAYGVSVAAERLKKVTSKGSRSIPWRNFTIIDFAEKPELTILPDVKEPTLAQVTARRKRETAKKIDDAEKDPPTELMADMGETVEDDYVEEGDAD